MSDERDDSIPGVFREKPIPREWLPDGIEPEGDAVWEARAARVVARTELEWRRSVVRTRPTLSFAEMGGWFTPAAALAAAAAALLLAVGNGSQAPSNDARALSMVVAEGDPVALWAALGVSAHPVLALLSLDEHASWITPADAGAPGAGGRP
jgi:hypothetical protein